MLILVLAESELELIPESIRFHQAILSYAKKKGKNPSNLLLDSNYHHSAMKKLSEYDRRGRPDIVHFFLINTLESIANKVGELKLIIHTRNNEAIYVDPSTRIMRNYSRFVGLMEQLFLQGEIKADQKTLIEIKQNYNLKSILKNENADKTILFKIDEEETNLNKYFKTLKKNKIENLLCVVGGFPKGDFHENLSNIVDDKISIFKEKLTSWTVFNEIIINYENIFISKE